MSKREDDDLRVTPAAMSAAASGHMGNLLAAMLPGGIEAQEAAGQRDLTAKAERLPVQGTIGRPETRKQWESLGFVFGEPIKEQSQRGREVFVACTFPKGWSLKPTDHSMWSDVVDEKGRRRAAVFFKAAFYDFNAHVSLVTRYAHGSDGGRNGKPVRVGVFDANGEPVHIVATYPNWDGYYSDRSERHREEAEKWLNENFPDHENPMAYWD